MTRFFLLNFRIFFARHHLRRGSSFVLLVEIVAGAQALTLGERVRVCVCVCVWKEEAIWHGEFGGNSWSGKRR